MLRYARSCNRAIVCRRLVSQLRPLSQSVISRYPAVNTGGLSSVDGGAGREDIGFLKSSSVSIAPNFGPFDHSQAVTLSLIHI